MANEILINGKLGFLVVWSSPLKNNHWFRGGSGGRGWGGGGFQVFLILIKGYQAGAECANE